MNHVLGTVTKNDIPETPRPPRRESYHSAPFSDEETEAACPGRDSWVPSLPRLVPVGFLLWGGRGRGEAGRHHVEPDGMRAPGLLSPLKGAALTVRWAGLSPPP